MTTISPNLDDSARFENQLATMLREQKPDLDLSRVDLTPFNPLRAKIDCITISRPEVIPTSVLDEMNAIIQHRLYLSKNPIGAKFIAVHDPELDDLRCLIRNFPESYINHLEVAVDAYLPRYSNEIYLLWQLKEQLRHALAPHKHPQFPKTTRYFWDRKRWSRDAISTTAPMTTIRYRDRLSRTAMKIYIKTKDQGKAVPWPCVRTELTFTGGTTGWADIDQMKDLSSFGKRLRKFCSPAFNVGCGFKENDPDGTKWKRFGAGWTLSGGKALKIAPDPEVNRAFGDALNDLGRSLSRL